MVPELASECADRARDAAPELEASEVFVQQSSTCVWFASNGRHVDRRQARAELMLVANRDSERKCFGNIIMRVVKRG